MLWNGTDILRPRLLEWLFKNYDDTGTDKGSWSIAQKINSSRTDST
jgi:hypothetical protein